MYRVIFKGEIIAGQDRQQVKKNLAALHKVPVARIESLFSGTPATIKESDDRNAAVAVQAAYAEAGAICIIEPSVEGAEPDSSKSPQIICPKCGFEQPQSTTCKKCGIIFAKYSPTSPYQHDAHQQPVSQNRRKVLAQVIGKPGRVSWGTVVPAFWGTTKLEVYSNRVVEQTTRVVSGRHSELLTSEIDSVVIERKGNPVWLILGLFTLSLFGLGIIFFILYFVMKHKFLVVFSKNNSQVVSIVGDERPYQEFKDTLILAAEEAKQR